jgi:hypothetical protein
MIKDMGQGLGIIAQSQTVAKRAIKIGFDNAINLKQILSSN